MFTQILLTIEIAYKNNNSNGLTTVRCKTMQEAFKLLDDVFIEAENPQSAIRGCRTIIVNDCQVAYTKERTY